MTQKFKVQKNGKFFGCPKGNKKPEICVNCEDCLSIQTFYGIKKVILCRCGGIEGYGFNKGRRW